MISTVSAATDNLDDVVKSDATLKTDEGDLEYLAVKILAQDGSLYTYKLYSGTTKNITETEEYKNGIITESTLIEGAVIGFFANSNRVIEVDDLKLITTEETGINTVNNSNVNVNFVFVIYEIIWRCN